MNSVATTGSDRQGLRELSRGVLGEAEAEARQTLEDARARADSIRQEAQRQSEVMTNEIVESAKQKVGPIRGQALATAQLEAQRLRLESRERLLIRVFSGARQEFKRAAQQPDYADLLHRLIHEAVANLATEDIILHADRQTQQHLSDGYLAELGEQLDVNLRLGELLDDETGIVAETPDSHRRYRNTLETRLERIAETLRAPVYRLLRGEAL